VIRKSKSNSVYFSRPDRLLMLVVTGAAMDLGKLLGFLRGLIDSLTTK
jgi:hypothetical protein